MKRKRKSSKQTGGSTDSSSDEDPLYTPKCSKMDSTGRSSERLREKGSRVFSMPSREEVLQSIPSKTSPGTSVDHLKPRKLVNNFTKENHRYNYDRASTDDSSLEDFIDDDIESESSEATESYSDRSQEKKEEVDDNYQLRQTNSATRLVSSSDSDENTETRHQQQNSIMESDSDDNKQKPDINCSTGNDEMPSMSKSSPSQLQGADKETQITDDNNDECSDSEIITPKMRKKVLRKAASGNVLHSESSSEEEEEHECQSGSLNDIESTAQCSVEDSAAPCDEKEQQQEENCVDSCAVTENHVISPGTDKESDQDENLSEKGKDTGLCEIENKSDCDTAKDKGGSSSQAKNSSIVKNKKIGSTVKGKRAAKKVKFSGVDDITDDDLSAWSEDSDSEEETEEEQAKRIGEEEMNTWRKAHMAVLATVKQPADGGYVDRRGNYWTSEQFYRTLARSRGRSKAGIEQADRGRLIPCSVSQVQNEQFLNSRVNIHRNKVTVVGLVESVLWTGERMEYRINDMTSSCLRVESVDTQKKEKDLPTGRYVRVTGWIVPETGARYKIMADQVRELADMNELTMHILEVIKINAAISKNNASTSPQQQPVSGRQASIPEEEPSSRTQQEDKDDQSPIKLSRSATNSSIVIDSDSDEHSQPSTSSSQPSTSSSQPPSKNKSTKTQGNNANSSCDETENGRPTLRKRTTRRKIIDSDSSDSESEDESSGSSQDTSNSGATYSSSSEEEFYNSDSDGGHSSSRKRRAKTLDKKQKHRRSCLQELANKRQKKLRKK